eukprot:1951625-Rhodomonas_salina.2
MPSEVEARFFFVASLLCISIAHSNSAQIVSLGRRSHHAGFLSALKARALPFPRRLRGGDGDEETENILPEISTPTLEDLRGEDGMVDLREPPQHRQERFRKSAEQVAISAVVLRVRL